VPLPAAISIAGNPTQLSLQAVASWLFNKTQKTLPSTLPQDCAGYYGAGCSSGTGGFILPDFKLNLSASVSSGPISWRVVGRMIGGSICTRPRLPMSPTSSRLVRRFHDQLRHRQALQHGDGRQQPYRQAAAAVRHHAGGRRNTDVSLYDVAGRRYFVGVSVKF
jgi:iron complex outermembrane receptor protein